MIGDKCFIFYDNIKVCNDWFNICINWIDYFFVFISIKNYIYFFVNEESFVFLLFWF